MSVVRGRPPGLAAGIRGASTAYCSSLSACPAPKSPTKTRLSAVHMTCLQEGLLPSLNGWHDHSISSSVSTARASQTGSKAEKAYSEALAIYRELAARDPGAYRPNVAITLNVLGILYNDTGRLAEAEKVFSEALTIYRDLEASNPTYANRVTSLAQALAAIRGK